MLLYEFEPQSPSGRVVPPEPGVAGTASGFSLEVFLYGAAAAAFAALALVLLIRARRNLSAAAFTLGCLLTAMWMGTAAFEFWKTGTLLDTAFALDMVSALGWGGFVATLLWSIPGPIVHRYRYAFVTVAAAVVTGSRAAGLGYLWLGPERADLPFMAVRLLLIIATAVLLENLVRNTVSDQWWSLKFLCLGLGGVLAFDLFLYADGFLFTALNKSLVIARGGVYALVAPLLFVAAVRRDMWQEQIVLSHKSAFFSTAIIASGGYLAVMAGAAFYIRQLGGTWGPVVQILFLFGALVTGLIVVSSGSSRAFLRVAVAKHFFRYKYDYRDEWLRFTGILSENEGASPIALRVTQAVADVVESTGGALWIRDGSRYALAATLHTTARSLSEEEAGPLEQFLRETGWIISLDELSASSDRYSGLSLPQTLEGIERAWIIVPLVHRSELIAFVLLLQPRAPRSLDWEDFDLLKLIGRHAASFVAEHRANQALIESQQFERFNRRTAFVLHDIKNIVSQLSLFACNIQKHGDKPAFREDLAAAVDDAVGRMQRLVDQLREGGDPTAQKETVSLLPLLAKLINSLPNGSVEFSCENAAEHVAVSAKTNRLWAMVGHIVQNALDVSKQDGVTRISLGTSETQALIEVSDDGPGMDPDFVRTELFKPFRSTKEGGLGIGAYQCRDYARELGGDIEVISSPGSGTTMRIVLPLAVSADRKRDQRIVQTL